MICRLGHKHLLPAPMQTRVLPTAPAALVGTGSSASKQTEWLPLIFLGEAAPVIVVSPVLLPDDPDRVCAAMMWWMASGAAFVVVIVSLIAPRGRGLCVRCLKGGPAWTAADPLGVSEKELGLNRSTHHYW